MHERTHKVMLKSMHAYIYACTHACTHAKMDATDTSIRTSCVHIHPYAHTYMSTMFQVCACLKRVSFIHISDMFQVRVIACCTCVEFQVFATHSL
jgi:hypothetical protein